MKAGNKVTHEEILDKVAGNDISVEQAMQSLTEIDYCPCLLNDDNGRWAVVFDGMQSITSEDEPQDVEALFFIEAHRWCGSIREALLFALSN